MILSWQNLSSKNWKKDVLRGKNKKWLKNSEEHFQYKKNAQINFTHKSEKSDSILIEYLIILKKSGLFFITFSNISIYSN